MTRRLSKITSKQIGNWLKPGKQDVTFKLGMPMELIDYISSNDITKISRSEFLEKVFEQNTNLKKRSNTSIWPR